MDPRTTSASHDPSDTSEALSNEVLKLKVDDLFQEVENLRRRVERLEGGGQGGAAKHASGQAVPPHAVVSDPD